MARCALPPKISQVPAHPAAGELWAPMTDPTTTATGAKPISSGAMAMAPARRSPDPWRPGAVRVVVPVGAPAVTVGALIARVQVGRAWPRPARFGSHRDRGATSAMRATGTPMPPTSRCR